MRYTIATIPGDGVGPEIMEEAVLVLEKVGEVYGHDFHCVEVMAGTKAVEQGKAPLPEESLKVCRQADSVLMGKLAVGEHPKLRLEERPEHVLARLRMGLQLKSDIRPAFFWRPLKQICPLKEEIQALGMEIMMVRDIAGGMYAAKGRQVHMVDTRAAWDTESYDTRQVEVSARLAFALARKRKKKVTSLDKAILLSSSVLWRQVVEEVHKGYPDVELEHMLVDDGAFRLISHPDRFDVLLASNVFGDIIADEIAGLTGAGGILPAGSLDEEGKGLYTPNQLHRVFAAEKGRGTADPLGMILAAGMLLRYSLGLEREAQAVEDGVRMALEEGNATPDLWTSGKKRVTTAQMGDAVRKNIRRGE